VKARFHKRLKGK